MVCTTKDLDIEPKLTRLGSTSNENQKCTLVGIISSVPISSTYNPTHSPYNATPSCPMSSFKMVSPRFAKLSIANDNLEGSPNKPMVQSNEIVAYMNVEKEYVNSLVNNPTTCSIVEKEVQDSPTTTKSIDGKLFPIIVIQLFGFMVFLWGCSLVISMVKKFQGAN
jgi:hypothetical protein